MVDVITKHTAESLSMSGESTDFSTLRTSLRRVWGRYFNELTSTPSKLVLQHVGKLRPSSSSNATGKTVVLEHALDVELLDDNRAVALGIGSRQLVQDVVALSLDLTVNTTCTVQGFCSVLGSFLSSSNSSLSATESLQGFFKVSRIPHLSSVGIREQISDASIDSHHRNDPRTWIGDFVFAQDAGEPLISISPDRAGLRLSFERSVDHDLQRIEFRKVQLVAGESPNFGVRFAKSQNVPSASLPARSIGKLLETPLPCLVQLHEQLSAHIARDFREPWQFSSQPGQLVDLIESGYVLPLIARPSKPDRALLVSKIPQETQGTLPAAQIGSLPLIRIDAKAKTLANEHGSSLPLVYVAVKRVPNRTPCSFFSHCAFGLRAEIPEKSHLAACLRGAPRSLGNGLCRLRVQTQGGGVRERSRSLARRIPTQSSPLHSGQFPERSLGSNASIDSITRSGREALGRTFLVPFVLCRFVRWGSSRNCQTVRGTTTREPRFLPSLKEGVSARETG